MKEGADLEILLIEDNDDHAELVRRAFQKRRDGFTLVRFDSCGAVLAALDRLTPALILCDYLLPDGSGLDLYQQNLRRRFADVPAVLLTGQGDETVAVQALKSGITEYIVKSETSLLSLPDLCRALIREAGQRMERAKSVEVLRVTQAKQLAMMANSSDVMANVDLRGVLTYLSPNIERLFGWSPQELVGRGWIEAMHPDDREPAQRLFQELLGEPGVPMTAEFRFRGHGCCCRHVSLTATNLSNDPLIEGIMINYHDITKRKEAEQQLEELSQRLQLATSAARLGVWDWNVRDNVMLWDDRMFELYGITRETFPNSIDAWLSGLHPEDKEAAVAACEAALRGEQEFHTSFRVLLPNGGVRYIRANALVIAGGDGQAERMIGVNSDITEMKESELERARLEAQLLQAQKMESVGRLAGGIAHDFNNMLSVIVGYAALALTTIDPSDPLHDQMQEIYRAGERSAELTRQLLAFARKQVVAPKVLDLNEVVSGMLKMLRRLIGEGIQLKWHPAADLWPVNVDPSQIDQILANLCVNARDAITDVGGITIETENRLLDAESLAPYPDAEPGPYVRLAVTDDGRGMDDAVLPHVFEPFFTTKELGSGTGLGLATVYGIVQQNRGFLRVSSEPGVGTTFEVFLPRHAGKERATTVAERSGAVPHGRETILLVEDEPAILSMVAVMLTRQGYTVFPANSPEEALSLARRHLGGIDLLVTDLVMPGMNGQELARQVTGSNPRLRYLLMSGYTADIVAHCGVLEEGLHFIHKPFSLPALAAKVREVLDREPSSREASLSRMPLPTRRGGRAPSQGGHRKKEGETQEEELFTDTSRR